MGFEVLLFVPNIIGYIRLVLLFVSLPLYDYPKWFLAFYISSAVLDWFDGFFARKLNQTSVFGAWFDVVIDLATRGALWCFLSKWGYFVMMLEWMTFVSTHSRGSNWKIPDEEFPTICKMVMANGFKTPTGFLAITGIFVLPLWLYGMQLNVLNFLEVPVWIQYSTLLVLVVGRFLAFTAEIFYICQHLKGLLHEGDEKG